MGKRREGGRGGEKRREENVTFMVCLFQKNGNLGYEYFKTKPAPRVCSFRALRSHWDEC